MSGPYLNFLGYASFQAGNFSDAVAAFEENHARRGPKIHAVLAFWAASYSMNGQIEKGEKIVAQLIKRYPGISVSTWPSHWELLSNLVSKRSSCGGLILV